MRWKPFSAALRPMPVHRLAMAPCPATHQNILEFWRCNCNSPEIAEGIRPALA
jgi:hypothetical protein